MEIALNGRTLSLAGVFPLRMKDLKALARLGLLRPDAEENTFTLADRLESGTAYVLYVLQKIDASIQAEEIDNLEPAQFGIIQAQINQARQEAETVHPFSSTSSTPSPVGTGGR